MSKSLIVMVVGASRGIGRALVEQFAQNDGIEVIATVRKQSDASFTQSNVKSVILDLNDPESISQAAAQVKEVDIMLVNAGMGVAEPIMDLDEAGFRLYLDVNVVGPWRVVKAFLPALRARKTRKIVFTSSMSGSMQLNYEGQASVRGAYALTKAAINMFALQLHQDFNESEGFTVIPVHPGWVDTALGNPGSAYQGAMPPAKSAAGIAKVALNLESKDSGAVIRQALVRESKFRERVGSIIRVIVAARTTWGDYVAPSTACQDYHETIGMNLEKWYDKTPTHQQVYRLLDS